MIISCQKKMASLSLQATINKIDSHSARTSSIHITWQLVRSEDVWDSEISVLTSSAHDPDAHPHWRPTGLESLLPSDT